MKVDIGEHVCTSCQGERTPRGVQIAVIIGRQVAGITLTTGTAGIVPRGIIGEATAGMMPMIGQKARRTRRDGMAVTLKSIGVGVQMWAPHVGTTSLSRPRNCLD